MSQLSVFPNLGLRIFSSLLHTLGSSVLAFLFARRTVFEELGSLRGWRQLSFARLCLILVFADSWLFLTFTGVLLHGVGIELNKFTCSLGIFSCILLYTSSKVLIYFFLAEKVWVVWSTNVRGIRPKRRHSPVYLICLITIILYTVCFSLMLVFRIAHLREDRVCVIGLQRPASLTLVTYDVYVTFLLTSLFVYPLWRRDVSPQVRKVASRTLISSLVALATSSVNIAVLTAMHGRQPGWICLASCGGDVTVNALVLYLITRGRTKPHGAITPGRPSTNGPFSYSDDVSPHTHRVTFARDPDGEELSTNSGINNNNNRHVSSVPVQVMIRTTILQSRGSIDERDMAKDMSDLGSSEYTIPNVHVKPDVIMEHPEDRSPPRDHTYTPPFPFPTPMSPPPIAIQPQSKTKTHPRLLAYMRGDTGNEYCADPVEMQPTSPRTPP